MTTTLDAPAFPIIASQDLTWDAKTKTFTGLASKLGINGVVPREVSVRSKKTGNVLEFLLMEETGEMVRYTDSEKGDIDVVVSRDNYVAKTVTLPAPVVAPAIVKQTPPPPVVEAPKPEPKPAPLPPAATTMTPKDVKQAALIDCVLLTYDIATAQNDDVPNPSRRLWRVGFRLEYSCWVIPAHSIPFDLLDEFTAQGVRHHVLRFDPKEREQLHKMAREAIEKETARIHGSLIQTIDSADRQLKERLAKEGVTGKEMERNQSYRDSRVRAALKSASENLDAAIQCAIAFDETMHTEHLFAGLRKAIASLRLSAGID